MPGELALAEIRLQHRRRGLLELQEQRVAIVVPEHQHDPCARADAADADHLARGGKGGTVSLYLDGAKTGDGRVEGTVPMLYSADETCDIGSDTASPVSDDYTSQGSRFNGTVEWVQIDIADTADDLDHLITPEERLKIAMTKQ
jgi:hypothetical protein